MKIILLVNDSPFAYYLAKPLMAKFHDYISAVIFSKKITGSVLQVYKIYKKTHYRYFVYRSFIELVRRVNIAFRHNTVPDLAMSYGIPIYHTEDISSDNHLAPILLADIGITINFDQIVKKNILDDFRFGVFNVHASRLPKDKGVSPVLWAFARGDKSIWATVYKMDAGIDEGTIYRQVTIPVESKDTAFSLYTRVCIKSAEALAKVIEDLIWGEAIPVWKSTSEKGNYWSWPSREHLIMMRNSRRKFISLKESAKALLYSP